ncbi:MAG: MFS transporter [Vicinamibacteraceae bacterium]|nr:MFS transporter [Vicinamibacteraceae bacterium]
MTLVELDARAAVSRVVTGPDEWSICADADLLSITQQLVLIRRFEERLLALKADNLIHGPVHTSIGQEGVAVGAAMALRREDLLGGTHRAHHQYLARIFVALAPEGYDPRVMDLPAGLDDEVCVLLSEIMGLERGCSGGRGGSMHLYRPELGVLGTNAIVGGGVPHANGAAWAARFLGLDRVVVSFFGEGGLYQGVVHETCNLAALWRVPVVFCIENNQYAVGTHVNDSCSAKNLCDVALAYGMPGYQVDGMDPLAVRALFTHLVDGRNDGALPCVVEAQTYRYLHHAGAVAGSAFGYRVQGEESGWRERDPIERCLRELDRRSLRSPELDVRLTGAVDALLDRAVASCVDEQGGSRVVCEALWPSVDTIDSGLHRADGLAGATFVEAEELARDREVKYVDAIAEVTGRWLERDPHAVVIGEEITNLGGGAYGATKGLVKRFPERVINTPISEAGFCGLACGAALTGMRAIVEIMFPNFILVAADQLFNQVGQLAHIYGGRPRLAYVLRSRVAIGCGYGAQHSMDPAAIFALFPGWRVLAPSTPFDYIGLFNAAMLAESPTLILEHHELYASKGLVPSGPPDHVVAPDRAKVVRPGRDLTVASYGWTLHQVLEAALGLASEGIDVEVVDLRALDRASVDFATLGASIRKTNVLVTVEQSPRSHSLGAWIGSECMSRFFDEFDAPPHAVTGLDVPLPVSKRLETAAIPDVVRIADAIRLAARRRL